MRIRCCFLMAAFVATLAPGQTPEAFLASFPAPPSNLCTAGAAERQAFGEKVGKLVSTLDERIQLKTDQENQEGRAAGASLEKRMLGGKGRPSQAEMDRVENMSQQEKMAWAMAQMGQMNPQAMQEMASRGQATQEALQLSKEATVLRGRITQAKAKLKALDEELGRLRGSSGGRSFSSRPLAPVAADACRQLGPKYLNLLGEYLAALKAALPDYQRQAVAQAKAAGLAPAKASSTEALTELRDYLNELLGAYKFSPLTD